MLDDHSIKKILAYELSLSERVHKLVDEAISAGGHDNITVILCEIGTAS
jgi:protein phosphatase